MANPAALPRWVGKKIPEWIGLWTLGFCCSLIRMIESFGDFMIVWRTTKLRMSRIPDQEQKRITVPLCSLLPSAVVLSEWVKRAPKDPFWQGIWSTRGSQNYGSCTPYTYLNNTAKANRLDSNCQVGCQLLWNQTGCQALLHLPWTH